MGGVLLAKVCGLEYCMYHVHGGHSERVHGVAYVREVSKMLRRFELVEMVCIGWEWE
jgi:hypothetical protein